MNFKELAKNKIQADAIEHFLNGAATEYLRARNELGHQPLNSLHEGWAILMEEVEELWDEVKMKAKDRCPRRIDGECLQIAAMAMAIAMETSPSRELYTVPEPASI